MSRISRPLALVVLLVATTGAPAWARDVCFTLPGLAGSVNFVAKSFAVPGRNKCRAIMGFSSIQGSVSDEAIPVTSTVDLTSCVVNVP